MVGFTARGMEYAYVIRHNGAVVCVTDNVQYAAKVSAVLGLDADAVSYEHYEWRA